MQVLTDAKSSNPVLLPNAELMELLTKDVAANQEFLQQKSSHRKNGKPRKSRFEHRDWIQQHVLEYLSGTPCVNLPISKLGELRARCTNKPTTEPSSSSSPSRSPSRKKRKVDNNNNNNNNNNSPSKVSSSKSAPGCYGLTQAEALQVLNFMPQEMVELHLMVEDLHDRLSESKQEELLNMIRSYNTSIDSTSTSMTDGDANAEGEEEVVVEDSIELLESAGKDGGYDDEVANNKVKTEI